MGVSESLLTQAFVQLADSLVDDFDIVDLLTGLADRCVEVLDADAAGILLADAKGLQVVAASSEQIWLLELFQLQAAEGPCLECFISGQAVINPDDSDKARWPTFIPEAERVGYRGVHAFPLRLRENVVGILNIFMREPVLVGDDVAAVAQALADVATIAVLQHRAVSEAERVAGQLQQALNSRIAIEQAKGVLAERAGVEMDEAFARLRRFARTNNRKLSEIAIALVNRNLPEDQVALLLRGDLSGGSKPK